MGWPEKLPSGRWRAVYRDSAGKRRSAGSFPHRAAAVRAANAAESDARTRSWSDLDTARRPWGEWVETWWPSRRVEASTLHSDEGRLRNHLVPKWGKVPLGAICRQDVKSWAAELAATGMGAQTVRHCVHMLSASLDAAVDAEVLALNPAAKIDLPTPPQDQERFLTRAEYGRIREQLVTPYDQLLADSLLYTGVRWGELAGMHRARVQAERGVVRVVEAYVERSGQIKPYPKGRRSRLVPVPGWLLEQWAELPDAGVCQVPHESGRCPGGGLLLASPQGGVLRNSNWAERVWRPALRASGVGHARIHDLRHTYASWLLQAGVPLAEVGALLGHVSPVTTQRYAHLEAVGSQRVLAALGEGSAPRLPHGLGEGCRWWRVPEDIRAGQRAF